MIEPSVSEQPEGLEPVHAGEGEGGERLWTERLVLFLRVMAGLSLLKGLYHWAVVCGLVGGRTGGFEAHTIPFQTATVFFAVIDLVAAVGLWLAAAWGAVVWLTAAVSMVAVELLFPQIYGGSVALMLIEMTLLACYLVLAVQSAREQPP
jgi:Family of unknown function (DUF6163)